MKKLAQSSKVMLDDWITPREAAEMLKITPHQVRHLARVGAIESRKFGYAWMVRRSAVTDYGRQERRPGPKPKEDSSTK